MCLVTHLYIIKQKEMNTNNRPNNSSIILGVILLLLGASALLHTLNIHLNLPRWLFHWEYIPIAVGIYSGYTRKFEAPYGWVIPIVIGALFLVGRYTPLNVGQLLVPVGLLSAGAIVLMNAFGRNEKKNNTYSEVISTESANNTSDTTWHADTEDASATETTFTQGKSANIEPQYINARSFMGAVEQSIASQNVTGGDISIVMGGAEINLISANIQGPITINCTLIMGGLTLVLPSNWKVVNEVVAIMGGVEDRRYLGNVNESNKIVYLKGTAIMGGIEIQSFK
jgi:hypothetical protein